MIFNIDEDAVLEGIFQGLEAANVNVTLDQVEKIVNAIDDGLSGVLQVITQGMAEHWKAEARGAEGWGTKYAQAITYKVTGNTSEIYLDEDLIDQESQKPYYMFAMMMEKGVKSWSIKDALLKSDKAKVSSDGIRYIVVPFPVATPRRPGQGKMQNHFGKREMTQAMYDIVRSGGRIKAGTLNVRGKEIDVSGLTKYQTRQFHGQYGFFRAVSDNSKGWIYPDVPPEPVFPGVLKEVNTQIKEMLAKFCKEIVKEYSK